MAPLGRASCPCAGWATDSMPEAPTAPGTRLPDPRRILVLTGVVASITLAIAGLTTLGSSDTFTQLAYVAATAAAISLVLSGAILASRLPSHPVGWLLWIGGCLFALASGAGGVGQSLAPGSPAIGAWLVLIGASAWVPAIVCVSVLLPLVFPTGSLPSPRWRIVVAVGIVSAGFSVVQTALTPFDPANVSASITNPIAAGGPAADLASLMGNLSSLAGVICLPLVAASLVLRFRHATGVVRAQLKWLAAAVAISGPALAIAIAVALVPGDLARLVSNLAFLATFAGLTLLPVAIGVAVLRYRPYEIDLIIRRTVVYVPLTAILAGLYAALTALLQRVFIATTGQRSDGAVIVSTLVLATMFTPVRSWLQGVVDRRFRDDVDAERQLATFIARVATAEWSPDPARTLRAFLTVAVRALDASGGRALVDDAGSRRIVGSAGATGPTTVAVPVETGQRRLGLIELGPKARGRAYVPREIDLVTRAGRRLATAIIEGRDGAADEPAEPSPASGRDIEAGAEEVQVDAPLDVQPRPG